MKLNIIIFFFFSINRLLQQNRCSNLFGVKDNYGLDIFHKHIVSDAQDKFRDGILNPSFITNRRTKTEVSVSALQRVFVHKP